MDDSGALLCQISSLKDMLDRVNEEIEANLQVTREIESEIVKCSEIERVLVVRESELMKMVFVLQFEITGLISVNADSRTSWEHLAEELYCLKMKRDEILHRMDKKREAFGMLCLDFQKDILGENGELGSLLSERDFLENEVHLLRTKMNSLQNSMSAFMQEVLEEFQNANSALRLEIQSGTLENEKLVKDVNELKTTLLSVMSM